LSKEVLIDDGTVAKCDLLEWVNGFMSFNIAFLFELLDRFP